MPIAVPKGGDLVHQGARVTVENAEEIMISFMMVSTYLTSKFLKPDIVVKRPFCLVESCIDGSSPDPVSTVV